MGGPPVQEPYDARWAQDQDLWSALSERYQTIYSVTVAARPDSVRGVRMFLDEDGAVVGVASVEISRDAQFSLLDQSVADSMSATGGPLYIRTCFHCHPSRALGSPGCTHSFD